MAKKKILIVEDNKDISRLIKYNFEKADYECLQVFSGEDVVACLERSSFDLIMLDIMLPGQDGFEVCRTLKKDDRFKHIPVLMLTSKGEEIDRVVGFELGADDYVVKPFSPRELLLRVKAILRRKPSQDIPQEVLKAGGIEVDSAAHQVTLKGVPVELTAMEFKLLVTLIRRRGRVQSREKLLEDVWGIGTDVYTRTIDTHVKRLREKLGVCGSLIETVVGVGYRFRQDHEEH